MADELKTIRTLYMYKQVAQGRPLNKKLLSETFGVSEKTIQRDIDVLREFYSKYDSLGTLVYRKKLDEYVYFRLTDILKNNHGSV